MLSMYITSTDHDDGKTFVTAGLAATMQSLGYSTSVYKPVQTGGIECNGFRQSPDLTYIKTIDPYISTEFSYLYKSKTEPLLAAEAENDYIDIELINNEFHKLTSSSDCTIIDGDGGILSPLAPQMQVADMVKRMQVPLLIVVTPQVNTINNTLLTIYAAQDKGIDIRGVIINNIKKDCSKKLLNAIPRVIEEYTSVKVLGLIPHLHGKYTPGDLIGAALNGIDIESIFKVKIEKLDM